MLRHHRDVLRLAVRALGSGGTRVSPTRVLWRCSGPCSAPKTVIYTGRPEGAPWHLWSPGKAHTLEVEMETPCRNCDECRQRRRNLWTARAAAEVRAAPRTWFCTLTVRPEEQYKAALIAQRRAVAKGYNWETLSEDEKFLFVHNSLAPELTRFIKRVRKNTGASLRYLAVVERHKSGLPHYHMLVHECIGSVKYDDLRSQWHLGFGQFKLTDPRSALYVTKYLSKDASARVRASQHYGNPRSGGANPPNALGGRGRSEAEERRAVKTSPPEQASAQSEGRKPPDLPLQERTQGSKG